MSKTLSAKQIISMKRDTLRLSGEWDNCLGAIDKAGVVFIWGNSGNGKSSAVISLCKELARFGKVLYVSLEEGFSLSFQNTLVRFGMSECGKNFQVVDSLNIAELNDILSKRRSPDFIVIDSFQYTQMNYKDYIKFKEKNSRKMLIFVSHADGKQPSGRAARSVKYDAMLKIWVEGYKAFSKGRFIGATGEAVIWEEGAKEYWGTTKKEYEKDTINDNNI